MFVSSATFGGHCWKKDKLSTCFSCLCVTINEFPYLFNPDFHFCLFQKVKWICGPKPVVDAPVPVKIITSNQGKPKAVTRTSKLALAALTPVLASAALKCPTAAPNADSSNNAIRVSDKTSIRFL